MNVTPDTKEWTVQRIRQDLRRMSVVCPADSTHSSWIAGLRRLHPPLAMISPAVLLTGVREHGSLDLGIMEGRHAHRLCGSLRRHGFSVEIEDASFMAYFPLFQGVPFLMEDKAGAEAFCLKLIESGASVESPVVE